MAAHSNETKRYFSYIVRNINLKDLTPYKCGWHIRKKGECFGPTTQENYSIFCVLSGKGEYSVGDKTYNLEKNSMFLIKPNTLVKLKADKNDPWTYSWITFGGNMAEELFSSVGFKDGVFSITHPDFFEVFEDIKHLPENMQVTQAYLSSKLYYIIDKLSKSANTTSVSQYCEKAIDFIQANYQTHITIDGISKSLGIDRRYFSRIFTNYMGMSPQNYLVNYRLERAKILISSGLYSVSEASSSVGYDDIFAFSKIFKKKYGVPPSKYVNTKQ